MVRILRQVEQADGRLLYMHPHTAAHARCPDHTVQRASSLASRGFRRPYQPNSIKVQIRKQRRTGIGGPAVYIEGCRVGGLWPSCVRSCPANSVLLSLPLCLPDPGPLPSASGPAPVPVSCRASCISQRPAFSRQPQDSGDPISKVTDYVQVTMKSGSGYAVMALAKIGTCPCRHCVSCCESVETGLLRCNTRRCRRSTGARGRSSLPNRRATSF